MTQEYKNWLLILIIHHKYLGKHLINFYLYKYITINLNIQLKLLVYITHYLTVNELITIHITTEKYGVLILDLDDT